MTTWANTVIELDVPDEVIAEGDDAIENYMIENGSFPWLCAQCAGGKHMMVDHNLDLGDEWEGVRDQDGKLQVEDA
jgi:hypothetical protein